MACFLAVHQTQTSVSLLMSLYFSANAPAALVPRADSLCSSNPDVGQFVCFSPYCPANAPAVLPHADSPCPTSSNTQFLLDDDLPPVSEALALPSHLSQKPSAIIIIPQIPRVTVRATTSDGKTIYLRKRKKPSPTVSR